MLTYFILSSYPYSIQVHSFVSISMIIDIQLYLHSFVVERHLHSNGSRVVDG